MKLPNYLKRLIISLLLFAFAAVLFPFQNVLAAGNSIPAKGYDIKNNSIKGIANSQESASSEEVEHLDELETFLSRGSGLFEPICCYYDYRTTDMDMFFFDGHKGMIQPYFDDIIVYNYLDNTVNATLKDPRGELDMFCQTKADEIDWILKNIYNYSDERINKLHEEGIGGYGSNGFFYREGYYQDGYYYVRTGGIGGFNNYGAVTIDKIEKIDGLYHAECSVEQFELAAGSSENIITTYKKIYVIVSYKIIDGEGYWSLYMGSDKPLKDRSKSICEEFGLETDEPEITQETQQLTTATTEITQETQSLTTTETTEKASVLSDDYNSSISNNNNHKTLYTILLVTDGMVFIICLTALLIILHKRRREM